MNRNQLKHIGIFILSLFVFQFAFAQKSFTLQDNPELVVSGTSTLHDWDMPSSTAKGSMQATVDGSTLSEIQSLKIEMPAESIKSGKKAMDKKAYSALKSNKHKTVTFNLKSAAKSGDTWTFDGTFDIAGASKNVSLKVKEIGRAH